MQTKTVVKEWGIKPWDLDKLTMADMQEIGLAEHTEAYIQQEQRNQVQGRGMKSKRNTQAQRDFKERNRERYGGMTQ